MVRAKIDIPKQRVAEFSKRYHIRKLARFGSVLCDDSWPDGDMDVLLEFEPVLCRPGVSRLEIELAEIPGSAGRSLP